MPSCAIANCGNYYRKTKLIGVRYFKFPRQEDLAKQWLSACKREDVVNLKKGKISVAK